MFQNSMTCFRVVCDCRENVVGVHGGLICPKAKFNPCTKSLVKPGFYPGPSLVKKPGYPGS